MPRRLSLQCNQLLSQVERAVRSQSLRAQVYPKSARCFPPLSHHLQPEQVVVWSSPTECLQVRRLEFEQQHRWQDCAMLVTVTQCHPQEFHQPRRTSESRSELQRVKIVHLLVRRLICVASLDPYCVQLEYAACFSDYHHDVAETGLNLIDASSDCAPSGPISVF